VFLASHNRQPRYFNDYSRKDRIEKLPTRNSRWNSLERPSSEQDRHCGMLRLRRRLMISLNVNRVRCSQASAGMVRQSLTQSVVQKTKRPVAAGAPNPQVKQQNNVLLSPPLSGGFKGGEWGRPPPSPIGSDFFSQSRLFPCKRLTVRCVHLRQMTMGLMNCLAPPPFKILGSATASPPLSPAASLLTYSYGICGSAA